MKNLQKDISVVIPCLNEQETIEDTIISVQDELINSNFNFEIIVVDNGSTDGSITTARNCGATLIHSTDQTIAAVRNRGVKHSTGIVLVFLDADIIVEKGWGKVLKRMYRRFISNEKFITGSHPCVPRGGNQILYSWYKSISQDIRNTHLGTGHMIVRNKDFNELGGFDESLVTGEDFDFCRRAKGKNISIVSAPEMVVYHHGYPDTLYSFIKREIWHGMGDCVSYKNFINSKASLCGGIFIILMSLSIIFLFISYHFSLLFLILVIVLTVSVNIYKFGFDGLRDFMHKNVISFLYLLGRGLSPIVMLFKNSSL